MMFWIQKLLFEPKHPDIPCASFTDAGESSFVAVWTHAGRTQEHQLLSVWTVHPEAAQTGADVSNHSVSLIACQSIKIK